MSSCSRATAVAHPNIALVKYWGKHDEDLVLPLADSLSMTLDVFPTTTTVRLTPHRDHDTLLLDGVPATDEVLHRVVAFLTLLRTRTGRTAPAVVETHNTVPVGAGLASSAAGFAALALAAATAYGADLSAPGLSRLARRGSGSACRSVFGGFVWWHAAHPDDPDPDRASYAEPLPDVRLDLAMIVVMLHTGAKPTSSRDAMRRTVRTSPLFPDWIAATREDVPAMRACLEDGDLERAGAIAERNALGMHATMESATPPVVYRTAASHRLLDHVRALRDRGEQTWATMDAGPNVKVLCPAAEAPRIAAELAAVSGCPTVVAHPGPAAALTTTGRS
ncbi:diphosphomevalonate decarboxylase [Streptomyces beigongshangae]|uniref:diphosphomevalonate decarboxylase n=1 Tax=Streptomyces beigongshangae TaxID=2841597 RepID=UPI0021A2F39A|nr:diphosphomevalonate decarboxylase [Streptomyces sp. REN17]